LEVEAGIDLGTSTDLKAIAHLWGIFPRQVTDLVQAGLR
jgi:hypothetical protein